MPVTSPLKWFGGKFYLAPKIIKLLPKHLHYVEPFAGSLAVLLQRDPSHNWFSDESSTAGSSEVVNDLHGELTNFWMVLQQPNLFAAFARRVEATPFAEPVWQQSENPSPDRVERAVAFFVRCRQSRAGNFKNFAPLSRTRTRRGMNEQASAWLTAVEGLPQIHDRLRRVVILCRPALEVIQQQDGAYTLYYLDPPYLDETRQSTGDYQHEMSDDEHRQLLSTLATVKGKFLLSGYPSSLYDEHAGQHGWRHVDFDLPNHNSGAQSKRRMVERVWMNF